MRAIFANAVLIIAVLAGLAAAGYWAYFIWSFDWGHSYRGRGLWLMALMFPAIFIFMIAFGVAYSVLSRGWEFIFREKFPS
jgi:hypothetical protein